jgi:hypothetical protein
VTSCAETDKLKNIIEINKTRLNLNFAEQPSVVRIGIFAVVLVLEIIIIVF